MLAMIDSMKRVKASATHDCTECGYEIAAGAYCVKSWRRAETHRERAHADARGNVAWYRHDECAGARLTAGEISRAHADLIVTRDEAWDATYNGHMVLGMRARLKIARALRTTNLDNTHRSPVED
jgi:hypothetical protein